MNMASSELHVGIIGCGVVAPSHAEGYQRIPGVRITWACDLVESKARALADRFGIPHVTTDYRNVLKDPDLHAVSVCTDHASHADITVAALDAGKHVLCEKALAATSAGLDRIIAAERRHPELICSGVFQHRFDRVYQYVKRLIEERAFGDLLTASCKVLCLRTREYYQADRWRGTWEQEGGSVMINQAIHFVDVLQWVVGGVEAVAAAYANLTHGDVIETEDTAVATVRFRNGALGSILATSSSHLRWDPTFFFYGSRGTLELRNGRPLRVEFAEPGRAQQVVHDLEACADRSSPTRMGKDYYGPSHPTQIADFVGAIRERRPAFIPAHEARKAVDLVLAMYASHREGRWIALPS
mgnify:CR=1 FL=1